MINSHRKLLIESICSKYEIKNYTINDDGTIDVDGNVSLYKMGLNVLPVKFNIVTGDFDCSRNKLMSLKNSPVKVGGNFNCAYNKIGSLIHSPITIGGDFLCNSNVLKSLKYIPNIVPRTLNCSFNYLNSLKHISKSAGNLDVGNNRLKTLDYMIHCDVYGSIVVSGNDLVNLVGSPKTVRGDFHCYGNKLTSLLGVPGSISDNFNFSNNLITNLDYFPGTVNGKINMSKNKFNNLMEITLKGIPSEYIVSFCRYCDHYEVFYPTYSQENYQTLMEELKDGLQ